MPRQESKIKEMIMLLGILSISLLVFFRNINSYPLRNWDEAWYAEIIKNMASGNYNFLMPFWNGRYYFDNSPLYFWLSYPLAQTFGVGLWQVRFISAISAIVATSLVFLIGKKLVNEKLGIISALVFLDLGQVVIRFAHGNLDALLTSLFLACFYFYLKSEEAKFFSILCGIALGLGILVKSWGIGLFPLFLIFVYSLIKNGSLPKNLFLIIFLALISFSWWYLWGILTFGKNFVLWYILNPSEGRFNNPLQNFSLYYFKALIRDVGFWFIPLIAGLLRTSKNLISKKNFYLAIFLSVSLVYIFFLNFLSDKSDWYNLPVYPLISLIIGYFVYKLLEKSKKIAVLLVIIITLLQIWNVNLIENIYPDRSKVGADLGKYAKEIAPKGSKITLDDPDFTSFLFYSDQGAVYTLEDNAKSEFTEWWKIKHQDLKNFIKTHDNVWIVTQNLANLNLNSSYFESQNYYNHYYFVKLKNPS